MMKRFLLLVAALLAAPAFAQGSPLFTAYSQSVGGSVTTANTFQSVLVANNGRKGCVVQNTSANTEQVFVGPIANATAAASINIVAGGSFNCTSPGGLVLADQISITSGTAGSTYVSVGQ